MTKTKPKTDPGVRLITSQHNNPKNPRTISPAELDRLKKSLERFGDLGGIVLNRRTGHLVGGHQRIAAWKLAEVPAQVVETLKKPDKQGTVAWGWIFIDGNRYTYREVDWSATDEAVANLAANKIAGEWDELQLKAIVADLAPTTDLDGTGFDADELNRLMATEEPRNRPAAPNISGGEFSLFELVMRHENKKRWTECLDTIRSDNALETIEEAIMFLVDEYEAK
jgi:ParB-like chromosome segregation protein Spo0J